MTMTTCPKCQGNRTIEAFSGIEGGVCFRCNGSGEVSVRLSEIYQHKDRDLIDKVYWMVVCSDETVLSLSFEKLEAIRKFSHQFIGGKYDWVYGVYQSRFADAHRIAEFAIVESIAKPF